MLGYQTARALKGLSAALFVAATLPASVALAHGDSARALSLVTPADDSGALVVRLTEGLAVRDGDAFRYLCPTQWGDETMGPAIGLRGGPTLVGGSRGLFVLDPEALEVVPHPAQHDPAQRVGRATSMRGGAGVLYQLSISGDRVQLFELTADDAPLRFAASPPWESFAVGDRRLQLVRRSGGGMLEQLLLSADGEELERQLAPAPEGAVAAFARMAGDRPYVVVLVEGGLASELGRLEDDAFVSLHRATGSIDGPVALASGESFVAVGGHFARFDDERVDMVDEAAILTCLDSVDGVAYACADGGLRELLPDGLGASWFELEQLLPPQLEPLSEESRVACRLQWQRFEIDLLAIDVELRGKATVADAGSTSQRDAAAADADGGSADGGSAAAGMSSASAASGCGCRTAGGGRSPGAALLWTLAALAMVARRRLHG